MNKNEINRIDTKKLLGQNINSNLSVDSLISKLKLVKKIQFNTEIAELEIIKAKESSNLSLFNSCEGLKKQLNEANDTLVVAQNTYSKINSKSIKVMDSTPAINGKPLMSLISQILTPLSNGLEYSKNVINNFVKKIEENEKQISLNVETIAKDTEKVKENVFEKIVTFSKKQI